MKVSWLAFLFIGMLLLTSGLRQGHAQNDKAGIAALQAILGPDTSAWKFSTDSYSVVTDHEKPALTTDGVLTLTGNTVYQAPVEYRFGIRLHPTKQYGSVFSVSVGNSVGPDKSKQNFTANISTPKDASYVSYNSGILPETDTSIAGTIYLKAVAERSLSWSEEMRKTLEQQMANAPKLDDMQLTLRMVVTHTECSAWLNGRFMGRYSVKQGIDPSGTVNISLYYGAALVSMSARPCPETNDRFTPVELGGFVNASALVNGQAIVKKPVDKFDQDIALDGTLFRFPAPDARSNDDLDLGPSWTRFANLTGYIAASSYGPFGGRWVAADRLDPSRFCLYVPYGQYKALHLIAAYDGGKDKVPTVTAQFYRPNAGHPINFAARVPAYTAPAGGVKAFPVTLANGKAGRLFHVVIPIDPGQMAWFSDLPRVGLELTKEVKPFRGYPDPLEYSAHGTGLPSGVHIYAATLEKSAVDVDLQPDATAHIWTAPATPGYTINLHNNGSATTAKLTIATSSYDGKDKTRHVKTVELPAGAGTVPVHVPLAPTRYGLHYLTVTCAAGGESFRYQRNFAYLHPDTRERGNWERGKGNLFGFWSWAGAHDTPDMKTELITMAGAGFETSTSSFHGAKPDIIDLATRLKYVSHAAFAGNVMYVDAWTYNKKEFDPTHPEETQRAMIEKLREIKIDPSPINVPEYIPFFPEPNIGLITFGVWPTHFGEADRPLTAEEQASSDEKLQIFLLAARAVKKEWPNVKILLPYGDPNNTAIFLRKSPEARELIEGAAIDYPEFERLPEQQCDQVTLSRLYPIMKDIKEYIKDPYFVIVEGTHTSSKDPDTSREYQADCCVRDFLSLIGYGVNIHESSNAPFECANYWGENHYGGGYCSRLPLAMPELAYVASATLTRHINRCNFVKYVPTGSTSVYCQQYRHYKTNRSVYVLWTIRGKRPVNVKAAPGTSVEVYDQNDNFTVVKEKNGALTFDIAQAPVYLEGLNSEAEITLGDPDHSDSAPAPLRTRLTNLADGWSQVAKQDEQYEDTNPIMIARFLGDISAQAVAVPKPQGTKALAVHLGPQKIDRRVMPYYTTFVPQAPIVIPGKSSHIGMWVKASSDWGRVVYSLRDAKGERWLSVGTKDEWNGDDTRGLSGFNFDGWRYLRFQMPSHAPYDNYRETGTSWWGSYGGDGVVDLSLKLEKVIVERRSSVVYGNDLVPAKLDDVLLGDVYAEYASGFDKSDEVVRLSKIRMPAPKGEPAIENPIAEIEKTGVDEPTRILRVADPAHYYDGTRCHVFFTPVEGAQSYDIWVSPYSDGRGAVKLGAGWKESGQLLEGLHADTDFYLFVVYTDKEGKLSKPSLPFKINLKNRFVYQ